MSGKKANRVGVSQILCVIVAILLVLPYYLNAQTLATNYFVDAAQGNDANNGLSVTEPFKTISKAKDVIRLLDKSGNNNITVNLRGGTYFQGQTLEFTEKDGGTPNCKITYQSYKDEIPVISGGKLITGWKLFDKTKNIYRAYVGDLTFRQLYVDGNWGVRARTPDKTNNTDITWDAEGKKIKISKKNIAQWKNFDKVEMVTTNNWTYNHLRLESFSTDSIYAYINIKEEEQCVFKVAAFAFHGKKYFLENAYEFLDSEGEWYLNNSDHYLYYKPRTGENISVAEVIAPKLINIVKIEGSGLDMTVGNIQFKGISFMHSTWLRPDSFGNVEMQAAQYYMPDAYPGPGEYTGRPTSGVLVKNAHQIVFERGTFANMGATGLDFISGTHNCSIVGNVFRDIAGNAISIGLTPKENESNMTIYNPKDLREMPSNISVVNNYITRVGKDNIGGVGVFYSYASDLNIMHNEMENIPYSGINGGWGWDSTETPMRNNILSKNYIHDFMKVMFDGGGIYTLSNQPNSVCSDNYIENMKLGPRGSHWDALYADEGTRNLTIKNNVTETQQLKGINWLYLQTVGQGAEECPVDNNYTNSNIKVDNGQPVNNTHYFPNADWPKEAQEIIKNAGLENNYKDIKNKLIPQKQKVNPNTKRKRLPKLPTSRVIGKGD